MGIKLSPVAVAAVVHCLLAFPAVAAPVGLDLTISGNASLSTRENYSLTNTSVAANLTSITIGITDGTHGYDCVTGLSGGTGAINGTDGICTNENLSPTFLITYTDFDPGETSTWTADIDPNSGPNDWRDVLANGTISVAFSDGQVLNGVFDPLGSGQITDSDSFSISLRAGAVPLPAALPLLASVLGGLGLFGWRGRRNLA